MAIEGQTTYRLEQELLAAGLSTDQVRELRADGDFNATDYTGFHLGKTEGLILARGEDIPESLAGASMTKLRSTTGYRIGVKAMDWSINGSESKEATL